MTRVQFGATVDSDVKQLIKQMADLENRSIANYIETLIRREADRLGIKVNSNGSRKPLKKQGEK